MVMWLEFLLQQTAQKKTSLTPQNTQNWKQPPNFKKSTSHKVSFYPTLPPTIGPEDIDIPSPFAGVRLAAPKMKPARFDL